MNHSQLISAIESSSFRESVECTTCGKPVGHLSAARAPIGLRLVALCHGEREIFYVDDSMDPFIALTAIPRRVFLRSFARYGKVSAAARRERREARP